MQIIINVMLHVNVWEPAEASQQNVVHAHAIYQHAHFTTFAAQSDQESQHRQSLCRNSADH